MLYVKTWLSTFLETVYLVRRGSSVVEALGLVLLPHIAYVCLMSRYTPSVPSIW